MNVSLLNKIGYSDSIFALRIEHLPPVKNVNSIGSSCEANSNLEASVLSN